MRLEQCVIRYLWFASLLVCWQNAWHKWERRQASFDWQFRELQCVGVCSVIPGLGKVELHGGDLRWEPRCYFICLSRIWGARGNRIFKQQAAGDRVPPLDSWLLSSTQFLTHQWINCLKLSWPNDVSITPLAGGQAFSTWTLWEIP